MNWNEPSDGTPERTLDAGLDGSWHSTGNNSGNRSGRDSGRRTVEENVEGVVDGLWGRDSGSPFAYDRRRDGRDRRTTGGAKARDRTRDAARNRKADESVAPAHLGSGGAAGWLGFRRLRRRAGRSALWAGLWAGLWKELQRHWKARYPACATASCAPRSLDGHTSPGLPLSSLTSSWRTFSWRAWVGLPQGSARESVRVEGSSYCGDCWPRALAQRFADCPPAPVPLVRSPHRIPLGLVLLSRGWLTPGQLREGLERQRRVRGKLGESLRALGYIHEDEIAAGLAAQWACPVLLFRSAVAERHLRRVPLRLQERYHMASVHYSEQSGVLVLAFSEGVDYALTQALAGMLECRIEPCLAPETEVRRHLVRLQDLERSSEITFERIREASERSAITESYIRCWGAHKVRVAACGASVWVRLEKADEILDLLFDDAPPGASAA